MLAAMGPSGHPGPFRPRLEEVERGQLSYDAPLFFGVETEMREYLNFYIDGEWVAPESPASLEVVNPATGAVCGRISMGGEADVDKAVAAAKRAFPTFSATSRDDRVGLLKAILETFAERHDDIAEAIMEEMGAPWKLAKYAQAASGPQHIKAAMKALESFVFDEVQGSTLITREAIGPCALITPWNWPINQIAVKVAPALAAGCTMVLKPSEVAPFDAILFAEVLHDAGVPPGVFSLVNGDGPTVGAALCRHPDIAMVSFTGSTRAGVAVAQNAAPSVKRVAQELGGKSANIILPDADIAAAVKSGTRDCFSNSGQSCNAPTRMFVPRERLAEALEVAKSVAQKTVVGDPGQEGTHLGPVASEAQWNKIQGLIEQGLEEGAELIAGGAGKPADLADGFYVKPTVFSVPDNEGTLAREEIFGPVLTIIPYDDEDHAVDMANDTPYGLSSYVSSSDLEHARRVARRMRAGMVHINGASLDAQAPFGGYKQSGNGREWGPHGIDEFLELKSVYGYEA